MQTTLINLIILGSANALPDIHHDNTHLLLLTQTQKILIDCPNNPYVRLQQVGLDPVNLDGLILTHFHPDHVSGLPTLLMNLWLRKRKSPLHIYGLRSTLDLFEKMMALFDWGQWEDCYPVELHPLADQERQLVLSSPSIEVFSSPVCHLIPTIGLRINNLESGQSVAYSCDSEPCAAVVRLAQGAKVLIHECAGAAKGHSSPRQAGQIARQAEVAELLLIHYPVVDLPKQTWIEEAKAEFAGEIGLAEDGMKITF
ncbi:MAG: MBL fold metallo-hydrolase [Anaerolineales bacterium]